MNQQQVFINSSGRLRSGWRLLIFTFLYVVLMFILSLGAQGLNFLLTPRLHGERVAFYFENVMFRLILLVGAVVAGYICTRWLEGLPWRALGLWFHRRWWRDLLAGSIIGIFSLALATAIATAGGGLKFSVADRSALLRVSGTLIATAGLFILAALAEEALFRGYPLQTMTRARLTVVGIILTSLAFAAVHMGNPNFENGLPFVNLVLAGVWLAVAYLRTRSLWFPLGVHWAWNWALGSLFGLPVSGLSLSRYTLLQGTDLGPNWLTGGNYGIEGGVACTIALVVSTLCIWRMPWVNATEEMHRLTSQENPTEQLQSGPVTQP